jgi:hypothetical protein
MYELWIIASIIQQAQEIAANIAVTQIVKEHNTILVNAFLSQIQS